MSCALFNFSGNTKNHRPVSFRKRAGVGGDKRDRTADLLNAIQALSQLSYTPKLLRRSLATNVIIARAALFVNTFFQNSFSFFDLFRCGTFNGMLAATPHDKTRPLWYTDTGNSVTDKTEK